MKGEAEKVGWAAWVTKIQGERRILRGKTRQDMKGFGNGPIVKG